MLSLGSLGSMGNISSSMDDMDEDIIYNDNNKPIYSRVRFLGQGTYGFVYVVKPIKNISTSPSKEFVVKQMKKSSDDEGITPNQLREISLLKSMKHEYIIQILDIFFTSNGDLCLVFEHCKMDLTEYMKNHQYNGIKPNLIKVM